MSKTNKQNNAGAELERRVKRLVSTITGSYQEILDATPFELLTPSSRCGGSSLIPEDLFQIAKELDPGMARDEAKAEAIFKGLPKGTNAGELWVVLSGLKSDSFRSGCFAGLLMGAQLEGASKEKMDRLAKWLFTWVMAERGFDPKPALKPAPKAA